MERMARRGAPGAAACRRSADPTDCRTCTSARCWARQTATGHFLGTGARVAMAPGPLSGHSLRAGKPPLDPKEIRATRVQLRQLKSLSSELNATIRDLNSSAHGYLAGAATNLWCKANRGKDGRLLRSPDPYLGDDFNQIEAMVATLAERASEAVNIASRKRPPHPVGRRQRGGLGPLRAGSFKQFTLRLLWDVRAAGGRLTFDKNSGTGTLPKVLKLLSPRLPPGFIPNVLRPSTLAGVKALDKKLAIPVVDEPSF
jgi:hypothetical protein